MGTYEDTKAFLPEGFYDLLAYVIPGAYLILSSMYLLFPINQISAFFLSSYSWGIDAMIIVFSFGLFYYVGITLTTFSHLLIHQIFSPIIYWGMNKEDGFIEHDYSLFSEHSIIIRVKYPSLYVVKVIRTRSLKK